MTDTQPAPAVFVRIFLADNSMADARLTTSWEAFVHQLVTTGCLVTSNLWVNRSAIIKMIVLDTPVGFEAPNVIAFPPPKS